MESLTTSGIEIEVFGCYLNKSSNPLDSQYIFGYDISIKNQNDFSVQLLTRQWTIVDSLAQKREIKGRGVVGEQPILMPNESYRYQSYCDLKSDLGWMEGIYLFRKEDSDELVEVVIPRFELAAASKVN